MNIKPSDVCPCVQSGMHETCPMVEKPGTLSSAQAAVETHDAFNCCGGNDEKPPFHCSDCPVHPWSGSHDPACVESPGACPHVSQAPPASVWLNYREDASAFDAYAAKGDAEECRMSSETVAGPYVLASTHTEHVLSPGEACTMECHLVFHMTGGYHRTDCPAYNVEAAPPPELWLAFWPRITPSPFDAYQLRGTAVRKLEAFDRQPGGTVVGPYVLATEISDLKSALQALLDTHCSPGCSHEGCDKKQGAYETAVKKAEALVSGRVVPLIPVLDQKG